MTQKLTLRMWGPGGRARTVELADLAKIRPALIAWAAEIGCAVGDLDYQVNDGLRVLGQTGAQRRLIDVCGLPRQK